MSLRKTSTRRTRHELTHLPTTFDPVAATVTLELSSAQTTALSPPVKSTGKQASVEVVGDVRLAPEQQDQLLRAVFVCGSVYPKRNRS